MQLCGYSNSFLDEGCHPERGNLFPSRMGITLVRLRMSELFDKTRLNIAYTHSTSEPSGSSAQGDCSWEDCCRSRAKSSKEAK